MSSFGKDNTAELLINYLTCTPDAPNKNRIKNNIVYCIEKYHITILATEFGIGTFELPQYLEELGWGRKGKIAVVKPKYDEAFFSCSESFNAESISLTSNAIQCLSNEELLKELFLDPLLSSYAVLILNEVHKRYVLTDTVLALLKKILKKRPTLKVVLESNTKEANFFLEYFNPRERHRNHQITSAILSIDEAGVQQSVHYLKNPCADYIHTSIETIRNILEKFPSDGDILVYLADEDDTNRAIELLKDYISRDHIKNINYFKILHHNNEYQSLFFSKTPGKRNVIFTLDLLQDAVTQDRICAVVDCGFMEIEWFEAEKNKSHKVILPVSKFTAELRSNWQNLHRKAKVFRLYTKNDFAELPERSVAKMRRTDLCCVILYLKTLAVDNILRFDFPSPPPAKNVLSALETLNALGAIDEQGRLTNPVGFFMSELPFCPHLSKALYDSTKFNCSEEMLTIAVMLQLDSVFIVTTNHMADCHKQVAKRAFEVAEGDLITLLNVYTAFEANKRSKEFCQKYYLNYRGLIWVCRLRNHFANLLATKYKITLKSSQGNMERILKCIVSGYFMNVAYLHSTGVYKDLRSKSDLYVDRFSAIYAQPQPKYVSYCNLYENKKTFMKNLTVISEEWLSEVAPHYYELK